MDSHYKISSDPHPAERSITLLLQGKFSEDALLDLERSLSEARAGHERVLIDLSEVTLVDRKAVRFLSKQLSPETELVNCPIYLRRWILQVTSQAISQVSDETYS